MRRPRCLQRSKPRVRIVLRSRVEFVYTIFLVCFNVPESPAVFEIRNHAEPPRASCARAMSCLMQQSPWPEHNQSL